MSTQGRTASPTVAGGTAQSANLTTHLTALIKQTGSSTMYPTEDDILSVLSARTRADLPYTYLDGAHPLETANASGGRTLIVVNPLKSLGNLSDLNAKDYVDKFVDPSYASSSGSNGNGKKKGKGKAGKGEGDGSRTAHLVGTDQPHLYDLAGKVWLLMQRRREDQAVVFSGVTNSGKSYSSKLVVQQLLRLSASTHAPSPSASTRDTRLANQVTSLLTLLESFGSCKTIANSSASQHGRYLELFFSSSQDPLRSNGRLTGAKVLTFGLNKTRAVKLERDERSFHVFYQLLAGASPDERHRLDLEDPSAYQVLARSGCYRLPGGPFSDDSTQFDELRIAMANLGFKAKHLQSIFSMLVTILLLGNIEFTDPPSAGTVTYDSAQVHHHSRPILEQVAHRLGLEPDQLEHALTNETRWIRRELVSSFLDARAARKQADTLMKDLYAILFAFVVETANRKLAPPEYEHDAGDDALDRDTKVVIFDLPGYQNKQVSASSDARASYAQPLINTTGTNNLDEFAINFANEMLHSYTTRRVFDDSADMDRMRSVQDGVRFPEIMTMDNTACMELLRGGPLEPRTRTLASRPAGLLDLLDRASEHSQRTDHHADEVSPQDQMLVDEMNRLFSSHSSFVANPTTSNATRQHSFAINHYAGPCAYDVTHFIERNTDVIDAQLINLLRSSQDSFVAKLVSGPSIAAQGHPMDEHTIVQAQVSIMPLRQPSAHAEHIEPTLNPGLSHPVTMQINATLSDLLESLDAYKLWNVICIRPNESGHPNSIDKRRVKMQIRSLLLPDRVARQQVDHVADMPLFEFAQHHRLAFSGEEDVAQAIQAFARECGWNEGQHFVIGRQSIWLSFDAWKQTEDLVRVAEQVEEDEDDNEASPFSDSPEAKGLSTPYGSSAGHQGQAYGSYVDSAEDLLIGKGQHDDRAASSIWNSEYDKGTDRDMHSVPVLTASGGYPDEKPFNDGNGQRGDMIVNEKKRILAVEVAPPTRARIWWLRLTWALTFWIPSFLLSSVGRMKRADVRIAWREKTAICMLIFGLCGVILFYIIVFGRLICPDKDKAWSEADLGTHTGTNDYYAAIQGQVYDLTKFYKGQHSDLKDYPTSSAIMLQFAGLDLTNYFPPPLNKACPGLVNSSTLVTQYANFTPTLNYAIHYSGAAQSDNDTKLASEDWYYGRLQPFLKEYRKGWLVYKSSTVQQQAEDSTRYWAIYKGNVYDLSNYLYTADYYSSSSGTDLPNYSYLNSDLTDLIKGQPGSDLTEGIDKVLNGLSESDKQAQLTCLNNAFYQGRVDFRDDAKCLFPDYLLLAFAVIIMSTVLAKFIAALQLGSKRSPELQDKFVLCQVPCYSEGEDSMRKTIDSLASLKYDDKRKLIFIICDGNIVGSGNDRPTPRIVLDILGVDPNLDPEPLMFRSVGEGGAQLNYAKVYSGLYEFEGHVVP
ncbi:hypothetical protein QFC22_001172 [Naganishia vaughanmartiniae]|uniref:Uncharacterized protein n=1 Tax=Naganishia vaughanmartiniae TaxID=1424756 RepID=A0ACC2XK79_9TREE|nr:hypothetical protein QFC22_001172 [Naganishia vaughanmartiniae]